MSAIVAGSAGTWVFAGSFLYPVLLLLSCRRQGPGPREGGRDMVPGEWKEMLIVGPREGAPGTSGTPSLGGFTRRGAGAQVRSETQVRFL